MKNDEQTALFSYRKAKLSSRSSLHSHKVYEMYFLLSGRRRYFIDHRTYDVEAGDIIMIPPNTAHQSLKIPHTPSDGMHERYLLCPEINHIPDELKPCFSRNHYHLSPEDSKLIKHELEAIGKEIEVNDDFSFYMYSAGLFKILTLLLRNYTNESDIQTSSEKRIDRIIGNVQRYIENNVDNNISLSGIAEQFGVTENYLSAAFKSNLGIGFSEFLTKTRIAKSIKLLAKNDIPVSEIAIRCGFNNGNYFSTVFKKAMKVTPTQYRENTNPISEKR